MKMRTILLSVFLSIGTLQAFAATFWDGDFEFEENGATTCTLINYSYSGKGGDIILSSDRTKIEANGKRTLVVTAIGYKAFSGHSNITSITIPNSVTAIGEAAFSGCSKLASITIPNSVATIGDFAFSYCSSLASVTIPNPAATIGEDAFSNCTGLSSVTLPGLMAVIGDRFFYNCRSLASVTIPNPVTAIGGEAFSGCSSLTSITIPDLVTTIGYGAFHNCTNLASITIPNSVTAIGDWAFYSTGLTKITVEWATPLPVNSNTFSGVNQAACILDVPQGTASKYKAAPVWKDFTIQNQTGLTSPTSAAPQAETLVCYPNPAKDYVTVRYELPEQGAPVVLRIYDMQGKLVRQTNPQHQAAGINETYINVGTLAKGVYTITLSNGKGYSHTKLLKE